MSDKSKLEGDWDALLSVLAKSPIKKAIELTCNRVGIAAAAAVKKPACRPMTTSILMPGKARLSRSPPLTAQATNLAALPKPGV